MLLCCLGSISAWVNFTSLTCWWRLWEGLRPLRQQDLLCWFWQAQRDALLCHIFCPVEHQSALDGLQSNPGSMVQQSGAKASALHLPVPLC